MIYSRKLILRNQKKGDPPMTVAVEDELGVVCADSVYGDALESDQTILAQARTAKALRGFDVHFSAREVRGVRPLLHNRQHLIARDRDDLDLVATKLVATKVAVNVDADGVADGRACTRIGDAAADLDAVENRIEWSRGQVDGIAVDQDRG